MHLEKVIENFEVLANSKGGIQRIRELIRGLAVRGVLTEKSGELHNQREEQSENFPKTWRWARIEEVADFVNGFAFSSDEYTSTGVGVVRMSDMKNGQILPDGMKFVSTDRMQTLDNAFQVKPNDIVMGMTGATLGKPCVNKTSKIFLLNQRIGKFVPKQINPDYLLLALANLENSFMKLSFGTGVNNLSTKQIKDSLIPLPPETEQIKIVKVVSDLFAICDQLEEALSRSRVIGNFARNSAISALSTASSGEDLNSGWERIQKNWNVVAGSAESISSVRQLLIDVAIHGQFFGKREIGTHGYPIDWKISDFKTICDIEGGNQPPKSTFMSEPKEGYVQLFQIRDLGTKPVPVFIPEKLARSTSVAGEILVGRYGASVGKVFRAQNGAYNVALVKFIYPTDLLISDFVYWFLKSSRPQSLFTGMSRSAQAGFNKKDLAPLLIPIPEISEQSKIIEKINLLMSTCDDLEKGLLKTSDIAEKFTRSAVSIN